MAPFILPQMHNSRKAPKEGSPFLADWFWVKRPLFSSPRASPRDDVCRQGGKGFEGKRRKGGPAEAEARGWLDGISSGRRGEPAAQPQPPPSRPRERFIIADLLFANGF